VKRWRKGRKISYEEDPDYATVYADNAILEVGETCRLIFYQYAIKVDDHRLDKNKRYKRLKFEVRLPLASTERLARNGSALVGLHVRTLHMVAGKSDPTVVGTWWKLNRRMRQILYDSETELDARTVQSLTDDYEDLSGRIAHTEGETTRNEPK
jgi:hypothetical protein